MTELALGSVQILGTRPGTGLSPASVTDLSHSRREKVARFDTNVRVVRLEAAGGSAVCRLNVTFGIVLEPIQMTLQIGTGIATVVSRVGGILKRDAPT